MGPIKVTILSTGMGQCSLTGKDGEGLTVSFEDGTVKDSFLSWRGFRQILGLKAGAAKPDAKQAPLSTPAGSGAPLVK